MVAPAKPQDDTRPLQAVRVADFLEKHPRGWREVPCAGGTRTRKVRTYTLLHRPRAQPDLFMPS